MDDGEIDGASAMDKYREEKAARIAKVKRKREEEEAAAAVKKGRSPAPPQANLRPQPMQASVTKQEQPSHNGVRAYSGPVPEGWMNCPPVGNPVGHSLLIPCKVPLGEAFNDQVPPSHRFTPAKLVESQKKLGREIGLVIDLTNTMRYYKAPSEWTRLKVQYVKVPCRGRDEVPDAEAVNQFVYEVRKFRVEQEQRRRQNSAHPVRYIAVHCTHGHNRTGYMIINYLMRSEDGTLDQAIQKFSEARPPGIYKEDYVASLFTLYHEARSETRVTPSTPEWKRPLLDLNGEAQADHSDDEGGQGPGLLPPQAQEEADVRELHNDDVLGDPVPLEQQQDMQRFVCWALGEPPPHQGGPRKLLFPGSQPVSLARSNMDLLRQKYYYVTWKADGMRYMMFLNHDGVYLIDRNFNFRRLQLRFPRKEAVHPTLFRLPLTNTLLDGEMVIDTDKETGQKFRRYLIYDLMMLNGVQLAKRPFKERWALIMDEIIMPRKKEEAINTVYDYTKEPIRIRRKDFYLLSTTRKILERFNTNLSHETDGLIFQGWDDPYVVRTCEGLLKWKYAHMNSVDFHLKVEDDGRCLLSLQERGRLRPLDSAVVELPDDVEPATHHNKIIECAFDKETGSWTYMRERPDKNLPNAWHVFEKVKKSIEDNITEEVLLNEIEEVCQLPIYSARQPRQVKK